MKKKYYTISALTLILLIGVGCASVPVTGRKQLTLVSNDEVLTSSFQQYSEFIDSAPISTNKQQTEMVKKVGQRIATAVENYLTNNGMADEVANYKWEFNLVNSSDANAFCMPGGKIVVYEGILPYTQDETGLAVVMGHEVAHAVAKHSNERMSQQVLKEQGANVLTSAVGTSSATIQKAATMVYGLGSQGVILKYSRSHELEADELGLIFMAMAGYDPSKAVDFWTRMSAGGSGGTSELLSTHPSDATRIKKIQENLPEALKYYKGAGQTSTGPSSNAATLKGTTTTSKTSQQWTF